MATTYTVSADRLYVRQDDGTDKVYYRGQPVTGLSSEDVDRFKKAGAIVSGAAATDARENPGGPNPAETSDPADASAPVPTGQTVPPASSIAPLQQAAPVVDGGDAGWTGTDTGDTHRIADGSDGNTATANTGGSGDGGDANTGGDADNTGGGDTTEPKRPAKAATKETWVAYATTTGQMTEDEANALTVPELRDRLK